MKQRTTKITTIALLMILHSTAYANDYCENGSYGNQFMWIESISSDSFINDSGPFNNHYGDQDHLYIGYADYSDQVISWDTGTHAIELVPGRFSHPALNELPTYWQLWIDLNADQTFSDDELLLSTGSLDTVIENIDLSHLTLNNDLETRMRISVSFSPNAPVCGSIEHGEVEDYTVVISPPSQNTLLVPGQYQRIQQAVDAASPGDRVLVSNGNFYGDVLIDKPLLLESSNGSDYTSIESRAFKHPIRVTSPNVSIRGFSFLTRFANPKASIFFDQGAHDGQIGDVKCQSTGEEVAWYLLQINMADRINVNGLECHTAGVYGILAEDATDLSIKNVEISEHIGAAIKFQRVENSVIENAFIHHNSDGIYLGSSNELTLQDNVITHNQSDIFDPLEYGTGVILAASTNVDLMHNQLDRNSSAGIKLIVSNGIKIINNDLTNSLNSGVDLDRSTNSYIENNRINNNAQFGVYMINSDDNQFINNEVVNNAKSLMAWTSDRNIMAGNLFEDNSDNPLGCLFTIISGSVNNQVYLNSFKYGPFNQICGFPDESNTWHSPDPLSYNFQGQFFINQMGNFYSSNDSNDADNNGITDLPYINSHVSDTYPLAEQLSEYIFE